MENHASSRFSYSYLSRTEFLNDGSRKDYDTEEQNAQKTFIFEKLLYGITSRLAHREIV